MRSPQPMRPLRSPLATPRRSPSFSSNCSPSLISGMSLHAPKPGNCLNSTRRSGMTPGPSLRPYSALNHPSPRLTPASPFASTKTLASGSRCRAPLPRPACTIRQHSANWTKKLHSARLPSSTSLRRRPYLSLPTSSHFRDSLSPPASPARASPRGRCVRRPLQPRLSCASSRSTPLSSPSRLPSSPKPRFLSGLQSTSAQHRSSCLSSAPSPTLLSAPKLSLRLSSTSPSRSLHLEIA